MIHWLSDYNYDFALASIPVQLLIILFYSFRRNLPIRSSNCFLAVMISNLTMTLADIVSCEMNEVWTSFPMWIMYAINMLYFLMEDVIIAGQHKIIAQIVILKKII